MQPGGPRVLHRDEMMLSHETPSCELPEVPPKGSRSALGSGNARGRAQEGEAGSSTGGGCARPSAPPPAPRAPRAIPPYLPAGRHGHRPARAAPAPPRAAARPEAPWRPTSRRARGPGAGTERERCPRDGAGAPGLPELCHAPDPPAGTGGGNGRRWLLLLLLLLPGCPGPRERRAGTGAGPRQGAGERGNTEELGGLVPALPAGHRGPGTPGRGCAQGQTGTEQTLV